MTTNAPQAETAQIRACINCVRAKSKCSRSGDAEGICQRCHRMNKVCQPSPPIRKHRRGKGTSSHETSKLEAKLDDLVTLLKSTRAMPAAVDFKVIRSPGYAGRIDHGEYTTSDSPTSEESGFYSSITTSPSDQALSDGSGYEPVFRLAREPRDQDAELFLARFQCQFVKSLPFVILSPSITAHRLRQERPFLWLAIMVVASKDYSLQKSMSEAARSIFAGEAFGKGTRSMDLLLAILVYTVWDRCFYVGQPVLINLIQLSIAMLYNLGLDKPPPPLKDPASLLAHDLKNTGSPERLSKTTNEERRALLGCFLLSSVSCYTLAKGNPLLWTAHSEDCLRMLEHEKEFDSDALLVQLVKLRLLSTRINDGFGAEGMVTAPVSFYLKSFEGQLQNLKNNIPPELSNNETLLLELHATERSIYEVGLSHDPNIFQGKETRRVECLWACANATNSWINVFLSIPPADYPGFSALTYSSMTHSFLTAYRLSTFEHAEWDRVLCLEHLDVPSFLEQAGDKFGQVKAATNLIDNARDVDPFSVMSSKIQLIKKSWEIKHGSLGGLIPQFSRDELYDFPMEFSDGDWLGDLLGSCNEHSQWVT